VSTSAPHSPAASQEEPVGRRRRNSRREAEIALDVLPRDRHLAQAPGTLPGDADRAHARQILGVLKRARQLVDVHDRRLGI